MSKRAKRERDAVERPDEVTEQLKQPISRRALLGGAIAAGAAGAVAGSSSAQGGSISLPPLADTLALSDDALGPQNPQQRRATALQIRVKAAKQNFNIGVVPHVNNGDEDLYPDKRGSYSKALPHNAIGEVDLVAYQSMIDALESGDPADFETIILGNPAGGTVPPTVTPTHRLINPQSGLGFAIEGTDSHQLTQPPAPAFNSAWEAGEIVENYWMAHLRDVPQARYVDDPLAQTALADINALSDYRGPLNAITGTVTAKELFRDPWLGVRVGPYLSQFWWQAQPFGAQVIESRMRTVAPGLDYLLNQPEWLARQNGFLPPAGDVIEPGLVHMRSGRDLGAWVHVDVLFQGYFQTFLSLGSVGLPSFLGNPYNSSLTQVSFGTLGGPHVASAVCEVAMRALEAVWFQKWYVHHRLRPEVFAGRVHVHLTGQKLYDIHDDALSSAAVAEAFSRNGTYFCPMAFPEGSPAHPAYGAGHATVAGACVTILKAMFDTQHPVTDFFTPKEPTDDGLSLVDYAGADVGDMTIEGELNKIASNVSFGRNIAGVHWRSDGVESILLGERVACSILKDQKLTFNEDVTFSFRGFNGNLIVI